MPVVRLGHEDGQVTVAHVPDGDSWTDEEKFRAITAVEGPTGGIWAQHKQHSATDKPTWVASDDSAFETKLARHYDCAQGEPSSTVDEGGRS